MPTSDGHYALARRHADEAVTLLTRAGRLPGLDRTQALAAVRRSVEEALGPAIRRVPPMVFLHATLHALRDRPRGGA